MCDPENLSQKLLEISPGNAMGQMCLLLLVSEQEESRQPHQLSPHVPPLEILPGIPVSWACLESLAPFPLLRRGRGPVRSLFSTILAQVRASAWQKQEASWGCLFSSLLRFSSSGDSPTAGSPIP